MNIRFIYMAFVWMLLISSIQTPEAVSQNKINVELISTKELDVCSTDPIKKKAIVEISIGNVYAADSLYGFDYEVHYDPEVFLFDRPLYINTLSEYISDSWRDVTFDPPTGIINGWVLEPGISVPPIYGNRPLVKLVFDYKGDCPDTSLIRLIDLNFTFEYKKQIDTIRHATVIAQELDKEDRFLRVEFPADTLIKGDEENFELKLNFSSGVLSKINMLQFDIRIEDYTIFDIGYINSISQSVNIESFDRIDDYYRLTASVSEQIEDEDLFEIGFIESEKIKNDRETKIFIDSLRLNDCSCVTRKEAGSSLLISKADTTDDTTSVVEISSVNRKVSGRYDSKEDAFIFINSTGTAIKKISVFDFNGTMIYNDSNDLYSEKIVIPAKMIQQGIYFAVIIDSTGKLNRIVLIKTNS